MLTFEQFLLEGGNVVIDDQEAHRIDLKKFKRSEIIPLLLVGLDSISKTFEKDHGLPLWNENLFKSRNFLSGSAFHFFNLKKINDEEFVQVKSTVGDIDTQVDVNLMPMVEDFLTKNKGKKFGTLTLIGFKKSAGQHISLWKFDKFDINVQIDFEFVEFDSKGNPTPWAQFSHSSAWEDLKSGIKGVAHKYLMQAINAINLKEVIIRGKTSRSKDKIVKSSEKVFSVTHGLRTRLKPVLDDNMNHIHVDGLPVYQELSTAESDSTTNLETIFRIYFNRTPSKQDIEEMGSFLGLIRLIKKYIDPKDHKKIIDGFAYKLWGIKAQGLYRDDKERDFHEKMIMMKNLTNNLGGDINKYSDMIEKYYKSYK